MEEYQYGFCPYDKRHRVLLMRLPAHIVKCRKNYLGPPLEHCMYNATHLVPVGEMPEHEKTCSDGLRFNDSLFQKLALGSLQDKEK